MKKLSVSGFVAGWMLLVSAWVNAEVDVSVSDVVALAEAGYADAQFTLAQMYDKGDGVTKDSSAALQWYTKAADLGSVEALSRLAYVYHNGELGAARDGCRALNYGKSAASQGDIEIAAFLGLMYLKGVCGYSEEALGLQILQTGFEHGNTSAGYWLAAYSYFGIGGMAKDYQKALYWSKNVIESSTDLFEIDSAIYIMVCIYSEGGYGVAADKQMHLNWLSIQIKNQQNFGVNLKEFDDSEFLIRYKNYIGKDLPEYMMVIAQSAADDWWARLSYRQAL